MSHATISFIEHEMNPHTGEKITPKIPQLEKIAAAMGMSLDELLVACDDLPGTKKEPSELDGLSEAKKAFVASIAEMTDDQVKRLQAIVDMVKGSQ